MGRAATGARLTKMKANTRPFNRVIVHFSGMRSCGDINDLKFLIRLRKFAKTSRSIEVNLIFRTGDIQKSFMFQGFQWWK